MQSKLRSIQVEYVAGDTALQRMLQASRRGLTVLWNPICCPFRQNIRTEYLIAKLNQSIHNIGLKWHSLSHLLPEAARLHIKITRNARKVNKITDICHDQWYVWKIPRSRSNGNCIAQLGVSLSKLKPYGINGPMASTHFSESFAVQLFTNLGCSLLWEPKHSRLAQVWFT